MHASDTAKEQTLGLRQAPGEGGRERFTYSAEYNKFVELTLNNYDT